MSALSRVLSIVGLLSLFHAAYSAHEHSTLLSPSLTQHPLPLDIILETLLATLLTSLGLILGSDVLKPISWSVWAGNVEKEGGGRNPFRGLEERIGFMDIKEKRKEFADWVRGREG